MIALNPLDNNPSIPNRGKIVFDSNKYIEEKDALFTMKSDGTGLRLLVDIPYSSRFSCWST